MAKRALVGESETVTASARFVEKLAHFGDGLPGKNDAGDAFAAGGKGNFHAGQTVPTVATARRTGCLLDWAALQVDAVEVVTGFFRAHREAGAVDQALEGCGGEGDLRGQIGGGHLREVADGQAAEFEVGAASADGELVLARGAVEFDFGAIRQLADDFVEHRGGGGGGAGGRDFGGEALGQFDFHIRRGEEEFALRGLEEHVGENGNGVATFNHALHVGRGLSSGRRVRW